MTAKNVDRRLVHGGRSKVLISTDIARIQRGWKERLGVRLSGLDFFEREHLREAARMERLLQRYDGFIDEHGPLKGDGEPRGLLAQYQAASNSKRAALRDFAERMSQGRQKDAQTNALRELQRYGQRRAQ
jgi:hypothetical protein